MSHVFGDLVEGGLIGFSSRSFGTEN